MRRHVAAIVCVVTCACGAELVLPPEPTIPPAPVLPTITSFEPRAAFSDEFIELTGSDFDPIARNNAVLFEGGFVAPAEEIGSSATHLRVKVPFNAFTGVLRVRSPAGTSEASAVTFVNQGFGHPILGTSVADLRFRHRPVGLVNLPLRILAASTLFDAVLDDFGRFTWVEGRPTALRRMPGDRGLLATRAAAGGRLMVLDVEAGTVFATSAPGPRTEKFVLPMPTGHALVARTVGFDVNARPFISRWIRVDGALVTHGSPAAIDLADVSGAAAIGDDVAVVGTRFDGGVPRRIVGLLDDDGAIDVLPLVEADAVPAGPVTLVELTEGRAVVVALEDGDLLTLPLDRSRPRRTRFISYSAAYDIEASPVQGHVLVTKPRDAALYDYDVDAPEGRFAWSTQLRGEPTEIDVSEALGEISIANAEDNEIDVVNVSDGRWLGRSSLSLGLGSADGGPGGIVGPYSYDPELDSEPNFSMFLLARSAPLVIDFDAGELGMKRQWKLDGTVSPPLRLAVTPDLQTLVVHKAHLGVVADPIERIVASNLPTEPKWVDFLRDGRVLLASASTVDVYAWSDGLLSKTGQLDVPASSFVTGLVSHRARRPGDDEFGDGGLDSVLVTWRGADGPGGAFFDPTAITTGTTPGTALRLPPGALEQTGATDLVDGPAVVFAIVPGFTGPALLRATYLRGESDASLLPGFTGGPTILGCTPDRRFVIWVTEGAGEHVVRVLSDTPADGIYPWSGYRLAGRPSGPATDPSGDWLYVPIPKFDLLTVVQ